ncbi:probable peroxisomal acyl-coenzyme A oxidase 1 [Maniola jurtina]|uniref:probable peroxisomal acyl-coenzyme A oxidase 1 n=1 Tax=Maniola jurtina TaxID=191418 RepID=UPI001E68BBE5|nr:probable peroxisomal acyl-coenzyme A oxidase 1 [Maniola jurtina]XP_045771189.1 probable peroxisomal acyl-coenzyme A oxidase 1 [Maniola jurtina]XP_045771198.1 probable peroxisomal acyl-coenzyme A oxidase 1 [Maniola jurtina]XP_045771207.1 probable peroxisomal acyl-coenzyme A oxidase 1 [Maniola jurtina]XP_045771216.1 probable peroxisomal acyl-coenzyme A oxidase 1 [Maniola jurtina]XP_045771226.1 probable peroxisomal acyl-coenzyme A oxidase 1 [Maniola jurtina]
MTKVNVDLQRERDSCSFNITELTNWIDGGTDKTEERKKREEMALKEGIHIEPVPSVYLSHKEKYELAVKKACLLFKMIRKLQEEENAGMENYLAVLGGNLGAAILGDGNPLTLHYVMFIPTIMGQGTVEQQAYWIGRAFNLDIIGTYAQTELGHGTFIRGLETTATYDPTTKEFVLHSPTLTSYKWWPGGLAHTANYCIVMAQLYTKGKCHGIHAFIVQLREEETHMPLRGIKVGEIGAKLGMNGTNNGFLGFDHVRIPRDHMLMKNSKVLEDGTYVNAPSSKLAYGTMMFVRVMLVNDVCKYMAKAVTIAVRYSAVRRQSQPKPNEPEPQIIDYLTQQHKLLVGIATVHAFRMSADWLWLMYNNVTAELEAGDMERLPELHALSCCLKAVSTDDAAQCVERCRLACGGHGYMLSSNLPLTYGLVTAACTYEGENTVMLLQTARYLVKAWQQAAAGNSLPPTVAYLGELRAGRRSPPWDNTIEGIVKGFHMVASGKIGICVAQIEKRQNNGMSYEDAWNMTSIQLASASEAHCRAMLLSTYYKENEKQVKTVSPALRQVLLQLCDLYVVYWALQRIGDLLRFTSISERDIEQLQNWYEDLLVKVRPNAVGLVDAFDIRDEILNSALGAYDGRAYERLMEEAMKSPLNAEPVNQSFHKYLKPLMQGKL